MQPEYKLGEDLKLRLAFVINGQRVNPDLVPFDIKIWTLYPHRNKTASYDGENWINCVMREDYLEVILNAPQFNTGRLNADITLHYPDDDFPDKIRDKIVKVRLDNPLVNPDTNDVIITGEVSDTIAGLSAYRVAVWNGYEGTEEEWLQSLKQPAIDAAAEAEAMMGDFAAQELARVDEENTRKQSELARIAEEQNRVNQELARVDEENTRQSQEQARQNTIAGLGASFDEKVDKTSFNETKLKNEIFNKSITNKGIISYNKLCNYDGSNNFVNYIDNVNYDTLIVERINNSDTIEIKNIVSTRINYFRSFEFNQDNFISSNYGNKDTIPLDTQYILVSLLKENNTEGYDDMIVEQSNNFVNKEFVEDNFQQINADIQQLNRDSQAAVKLIHHTNILAGLTPVNRYINRITGEFLTGIKSVGMSVNVNPDTYYYIKRPYGRTENSGLSLVNDTGVRSKPLNQYETESSNYSVSWLNNTSGVFKTKPDTVSINFSIALDTDVDGIPNLEDVWLVEGSEVIPSLIEDKLPDIYTSEFVSKTSLAEEKLVIFNLDSTITENGYWMYYNGERGIDKSVGYKHNTPVAVQLGDEFITSSSIISTVTSYATHVTLDEDMNIIGTLLTADGYKITQELVDAGVRYVSFSYRPTDIPKTLSLRRVADIPDMYNKINKNESDIKILHSRVVKLEDETPYISGIVAMGASLMYSGNSWFVDAVNSLGVIPYNKAESGVGKPVYYADKLWRGTFCTNEEFENMDILAIQFSNIVNLESTDDLLPTADNYTDSFDIGDPSNQFGTTYGTHQQLDYILKFWQKWCFDQKDNPSSKWYGVQHGKPFRVIFVTHWHDARPYYNDAIRIVAERWGCAVCEFDKKIGFSKNQPLPDMTQVSVLYAEDTEEISGVTYGWHPKRGLHSEYIQGKMAFIFADTIKEYFGLL